jgi:hypothetical protein
VSAGGAALHRPLVGAAGTPDTDAYTADNSSKRSKSTHRRSNHLQELTARLHGWMVVGASLIGVRAYDPLER